MRHDGGDTEAGWRAEVGGRLAYANAASGLSIAARALLVHEDAGYEEREVSAAVQIAPGGSGRGLSLTLSPTFGTASSAVEQLWSLRDAGELAASGEFKPEGRLDAEFGYGLPVFGTLTGTPYAGLGLSGAGRDCRLVWRLTPGYSVLEFELSVEGTWTEPANDEAEALDGTMLRGALRW